MSQHNEISLIHQFDVSTSLPYGECSPETSRQRIASLHFDCRYRYLYAISEPASFLGLFFDPYLKEVPDALQCWASFSGSEEVIQDDIWCALCTYRKEAGIALNETATVDIRFYSSLERLVNQGHAATMQELQFVQQFLQIWSSSYLHEFRQSLPPRFTFLWGSFHSALLPAAYPAFKIPESQSFIRWKKYVISSKTMPSEPNRQLPSGFELDAIHTQHFDVIASTSQILRTKRYLQTRLSASTALYVGKSQDSPPVAVCITAPDRSLSTLWVNPDYRGRGFGKFIARERLIGPNGMFCAKRSQWTRTESQAELRGKVEESEVCWSHADLLESNAESRKVCGWLGKEGWDTVWMRVEVRMCNTPPYFQFGGG